MKRQVTLSKLPYSLNELKTMPEADLRDPDKVVALTVAALCAYPSSPDACCDMLDFLRGPRPLSPAERQFLRDRFRDGLDYVARSYLAGAVPDNDYTPDVPYTVTLQDSAAPIADEGQGHVYRRFDVFSGGADTPRPVTLRQKPSTGEWFLWEQILMVQVRVPKSADPWA